MRGSDKHKATERYLKREKPILPLAFQVFENQKYDANNKRVYRYDGSNTVKYFGDNSLVAVDRGSGGNDGTVSGAVYQAAEYGSGLLFDGVDDYVSISGNQDWKPGENVVVKVRARLDDLTINGRMVSCRHFEGTSNGGYGFDLKYGNIEAVVYAQDASNAWNTRTVSCSAAGLADGKFHEFKMVYKASAPGNGVKIYIDGVLRVENTNYHGVIPTFPGTRLTIGAGSTGTANPSHNWFKGVIDEVWIGSTEPSETATGYAYNAQGRMTEVKSGPKTLNRYNYDANNKRTYRYDGANTVKYFGDNSLVWGEIWQGDAADWYFMDGYAPLVKHNDSGTFYYINDHLGTPILVTDENGNVVWKGEYDPFGKCTPTVAMIDNPIRFPGQYYDQETGLHYNWHRYYDAGTGRYTREDPIGLRGGLNQYLYVSNRINDYFDFLGLWNRRIHENIINEAFPNPNILLPVYKRKLIDASAGIDDDLATSYIPGGISPKEELFKHALVHPSQDGSLAVTNFQKWIADNKLAWQINSCIDDYGSRMTAYYQLGLAFHALADSQCSMHNFRYYTPIDIFESVTIHGISEHIWGVFPEETGAIIKINDSIRLLRNTYNDIQGPDRNMENKKRFGNGG